MCFSFYFDQCCDFQRCLDWNEFQFFFWTSELFFRSLRWLSTWSWFKCVLIFLSISAAILNVAFINMSFSFSFDLCSDSQIFLSISAVILNVVFINMSSQIFFRSLRRFWTWSWFTMSFSFLFDLCDDFSTWSWSNCVSAFWPWISFRFLEKKSYIFQSS